MDEVKNEPELEVRQPLSECIVELNHATVKWPAAGEKEDHTLIDISFTVRPGQVLAIVGQVGAGKVNKICKFRTF